MTKPPYSTCLPSVPTAIVPFGASRSAPSAVQYLTEPTERTPSVDRMRGAAASPGREQRKVSARSRSGTRRWRSMKEIEEAIWPVSRMSCSGCARRNSQFGFHGRQRDDI